MQVIAATNRIDILDPALLRSGRLDRKIEFPKPDEEARSRILRIHSRKMNVHPDVNYDELARYGTILHGCRCGRASMHACTFLFSVPQYPTPFPMVASLPDLFAEPSMNIEHLAGVLRISMGHR